MTQPDNTSAATSDAANQPKLPDQVRACIGAKHYSFRTEEQYVFRIERRIVFHGNNHPEGISVAETTSGVIRTGRGSWPMTDHIEALSLTNIARRTSQW